MESVWSNKFNNVAELQTIANDNQVVLIVNLGHNTSVLVCDCDDNEDKDEAVNSIIRALTAGCNYNYEIVAKIGNTYFAN